MKQNQSGFSLIETIVALGILATGLLGMAGVFTLGFTLGFTRGFTLE